MARPRNVRGFAADTTMNNETINGVDTNPTVLPAEGTQPLLDMAYSFGNFVKNQAITLSIGIAVGILICYVISHKKG